MSIDLLNSLDEISDAEGGIETLNGPTI